MAEQRGEEASARGVVSWRTRTSASVSRQKVATEAAPECELGALEGILANVSAHAGKKRGSGAEAAEAAEEGEHSALAEEGRKLLQSWLILSEKRLKRRRKDIAGGQMEAEKENCVPEKTNVAKNLTKQFEGMGGEHETDKVMQILEELESNFCSDPCSFVDQKLENGNTRASIQRRASDVPMITQPRNPATRFSTELSKQPNSEPAKSRPASISKEEIERKKQAAILRRRRQMESGASISGSQIQAPAMLAAPTNKIYEPNRGQMFRQNSAPQALARKSSFLRPAPLQNSNSVPLPTQILSKRSSTINTETLTETVSKPILDCQGHKGDDSDDDLFDMLASQLAAKYERAATDNNNHSPTVTVECCQDDIIQETHRDVEFGAKVLPSKSAALLDGDAKLFVRFKVLRSQMLDAQVITCDVVSRPGNVAAKLELRDVWAEVIPKSGDYVNVIWSIDRIPNWRNGEPIVVDENNHFFVLCPDLLVSPTGLSSGLTCLRRAILSQHVQSFEANRHSALGNTKHELVERVFLPFGNDESNFSTGRFDMTFLTSAIEAVISSPERREELFSVDLSEEETRAELHAMIPSLQDIESRYFVGSSDNMIDLRESRVGKLRIKEVVATEERIVSPVWGLRGQPDILARGDLNILPRQTASSQEGNLIKDILFPIELKTGSVQQLGHEAQVQLYGLLMNDRYNGEVVVGGAALPSVAGLLLHISKQKRGGEGSREVATLRGVVQKRALLCHLIALRNSFAANYAPPYFRGSARCQAPEEGSPDIEKALLDPWKRSYEMDIEDILPPPLPPVLGNQGKVCDNCFEKSACMLFHKTTEGGTSQTSGMTEEAFGELTGHLCQSDISYFQAWNKMIDLESNTAAGFQREIWIINGLERESKGRCVSSLKLASVELESSSTLSRSFIASFDRDAELAHEFGLPSICELPFEKGDYVSISIEGRHHSIGNGFLVGIGETTLSVQTSQRLRLPKDEDVDSLVWRIDKDDLFTGMRLIKTNLLNLLKPENSRVRNLVIGLTKPRFVDDEEGVQTAQKRTNIPHSGWLHEIQSLPASLWSGRYRLRDVHNYPKMMALLNLEKVQREKQQAITARSESQQQLISTYATLNPDQKATVNAVLAAQDYVCIHGMPGTGKTTTIAFIVQALQVLGCSVLVCAYTHTALDNLLLKLQNVGVDFVRIGSESTVHPQVRQNLLGAQNRSVEELKGIRDNHQLVIGATCLSAVKHPLIQKRRFDFCIVDEAGQLTQPVCFGPFFVADRFVLVGDDRQLPPLVKSPLAKTLGMDVSLLSRWSSEHPHSVSSLAMQFRMNKEIMDLSNHLIYEQKLQCGSEEVAKQELQYKCFPTPQLGQLKSTPREWILQALDPCRGVVFLDTDLAISGGARERRSLMAQQKVLHDTAAGLRGRTVFRIDETRGLCSQSQPQSRHMLSSQSPKHGQGDPFSKGKLENDTEALLTKVLVEGLVSCGIKPNQVGVISPYRSQLRLLESYLSNYTPELEIQTVDRYQGRDKDCIIVSLVRSNTQKDIGHLLRDWRRINVAFTRAKSKLLVIGSKETLRESPVFSAFIKFVEEREWYLRIPNQAGDSTRRACGLNDVIELDAD